MPKIKLSALVSDIKGKSNGSVFSKNKSGVYFRNNPSGGGKKSVKWDKQKSLLGSLSTQWKSLTPAQQEAWNDAVTNYQTTNAFGDLRIPSGYELFMRLNGSLLSAKRMSQGCDGDEECNYGYMCIGGECQPVSTEKLSGFPALVTPLTPRTIPDTGIVQLEYPDLFQLNPNKKLLLSDPTNPNVYSNLRFTQSFENTPVFGEHAFAFRFELSNKQALSMNSNKSCVLFTFIDNNGFGWTIYFKNIQANSFVIAAVVKTTNGQVDYEYTIAQSIFSKPFHVFIQSTTNLPSGVEMYIDGSWVDHSTSTTGSPADEERNMQISLGANDSMPILNVYYSDFRYWQLKQLPEDILLISLGYILDTEDLLTDCITQTDLVFPNYGNQYPLDTFLMIQLIANFNYFYPATFFLIPKLYFTVENEGLPGLYLNVYATPPLSYGKTGTQTNLKLLASMEWNTQTTFDFAPYYQSVFASIPPNSQVQLYVSYLDSTTGVQPKTKKKGNGKNVRFKAGADLTDKVN
jgi:hypothetical protein